MTPTPVAIVVAVAPIKPAKLSSKLVSIPASSIACVGFALDKTGVAALVKLPLTSVFQTTYEFAPLPKATSYPSAVFIAPTGV